VKAVGEDKADGLHGYGGFNGGNGIFTAGYGTGRAAHFDYQNINGVSEAVLITNRGVGNNLKMVAENDNTNQPMLLMTKHGTADYLVMENGSGTNKIRFDNTGKGFFNGGTQNSGADLAEAFDVTGNRNDYEAGDVLIISIDKDRAVEKSNVSYSTLVAGVYATKPGVLLTEEDLETDISDKVPMGVVGVIPTKVCLEGGEIKRGDLLVTSSIAGVAMKADINKVKTGQVIGKALENYSSPGVGKIKLLVNVK